MENANKFLKDFASGISKGMNVAKLGKVVKFYPKTMKVDVMPLPSEDNAMIINVPVATVRTKDFLLYYPLSRETMLFYCSSTTIRTIFFWEKIPSKRKGTTMFPTAFA